LPKNTLRRTSGGKPAGDELKMAAIRMLMKIIRWKFEVQIFLIVDNSVFLQ
jgi:hypothetical protein